MYVKKEMIILKIEIRQAEPSDAAILLSIYTPYVLNTAISFENTPPTLEEFKQRIITISKRYPYLVAVSSGQILGYAYASQFKGRAAYDFSAETSIYVKGDCRGLGIGSVLYKSLEAVLKKQNLHNLYACITYPNPGSIAFHEAFGYRKVAHYSKAGYKLGAWRDVIWMEKFINKHDENPESFIPFENLIAR